MKKLEAHKSDIRAKRERKEQAKFISLQDNGL